MKRKGSEDKRTVCMLRLFCNSAFPLHDPPGENLVSSSGKYAGQVGCEGCVPHGSHL